MLHWSEWRIKSAWKVSDDIFDLYFIYDLFSDADGSQLCYGIEW
jgi:hypothetical protein